MLRNVKFSAFQIATGWNPGSDDPVPFGKVQLPEMHVLPTIMGSVLTLASRPTNVITGGTNDDNVRERGRKSYRHNAIPVTIGKETFECWPRAIILDMRGDPHRFCKPPIALWDESAREAYEKAQVERENNTVRKLAELTDLKGLSDENKAKIAALLGLK